MAKNKEPAPAVEPGSIWQDRKSSSRYLRVAELHGSLCTTVNIDTGKEQHAFPIKRLQEGFRLTNVNKAVTAPDKIDAAKKKAPKLEPVKAPPVPTQIAPGQSFHYHDDLMDTVRILAPGSEAGTWNAHDTAHDRKIVMTEEQIRTNWVLILDPMPAPAKAKAKAPHNAPASKPQEMMGNCPAIDINGLPGQILRVGKVELICACGDVHKFRDANWAEFNIDAARFADRHQSCLTKNVLPFAGVIEAEKTNGEARA